MAAVHAHRSVSLTAASCKEEGTLTSGLFLPGQVTVIFNLNTNTENTQKPSRKVPLLNEQ